MSKTAAVYQAKLKQPLQAKVLQELDHIRVKQATQQLQELKDSKFQSLFEAQLDSFKQFEKKLEENITAIEKKNSLLNST